MIKRPLADLARQILLGGTLSDKLEGTLGAGPLSFNFIDWDSGSSETEPEFELPGRLGKLKVGPGEKPEGKFPKTAELRASTGRGKLLHFFANHELLAIETMALTLLRFPHAPLEFKQGVFKTLQDEQRHLQAYQVRMQELGVELGDFPLNFYFWNTLKTIQSPFDFVTRMSLTFEQANLDFALDFSSRMRELGDQTSAQLLMTIHDDEVKHVQHGLKWFRVWKDARDSDWTAYKSNLPYPLSVRRAKGRFFSESSRLAAGLDEEFIRELKVAGGSRGRVPDLFYFNPQCELEVAGTIAQGQTNFKWPKAVNEKILDLEPLMIWLGKESDWVFQHQKPPVDWRAEVHRWKSEVPEIYLSPAELTQNSQFNSFRPWGWSESAWREYELFSPRLKIHPELDRHSLNSLYSKAFWLKELAPLGGGALAGDRQWVTDATEIKSWIHTHLKPGQSALLKRAVSTSGRGHQLLTRNDRGEIVGELPNGTSDLIIERYLEKRADFSTQIEISPQGELKVFEPRFFKVDSHFQYQGAYLGTRPRPEIPAEYGELLKSQGQVRMSVIHRVAEVLKRHHYVGPVGIDGMIYFDPEQQALRVHPVVEVNVRLTMGRLALELESIVKKKEILPNGFWKFYSIHEVQSQGYAGFMDFEKDLRKKRGEQLIATTPAAVARKTWTAILLA